MSDNQSDFFPVSESYKKDSPNYMGSKTFIYSLNRNGIVKFRYLGGKPYLLRSEIMAALSTTKPEKDGD